ncbi:AAA family ATPase [Candidatus Igneacidithiobacillus taiwanensis]|uniref:AAA family ATPase n=1 Tax=Candidatus Igneacidithiobacillus taiwanensis TaxID=1945924 RepID=UPI0028A15885|nr:AAA family ATPase [Candidatus Igneacidithiobacillus taiwanensis]MCE5361477.1 AAA family ATPase [Acidithiobacillus sp.]
MTCVQRHPHLQHGELQRSITPSQWLAWLQEQAGWRSVMLSGSLNLAWHENSGTFLATKFLLRNLDAERSERILRRLFAERSEDLDLHPSAQIEIWGAVDDVTHWISALQDRFPATGPQIRWVYDLEETPLRLPLYEKQQPRDSMYPFLREIGIGLHDFYQRYEASEASILLLIGPPGTGKTSFIRGFLHATQKDAIVSYDPKILEKDNIFSDFLAGNADVLVIEDADELLRQRENGNTLMHRFLSLGDGLVKIPRKKMIFSTNIESISRVDPALLRPGRCFATLHFRALTPAEAQQVAKEFDRLPAQFPTGKTQYSLAEILAETPTDSQSATHPVPFRAGFR